MRSRRIWIPLVGAAAILLAVILYLLTRGPYRDVIFEILDDIFDILELLAQ